MECLVGLAPTAAVPAILRPSSSSLTFTTKKKRNFELWAKSHGVNEEDPLLQTAISNASLRFQETLKPEPLFVDPYASCLLRCNAQMNMKHQLHPYCVTTKFIDDKLLFTLKNTDGLKQVVLFTDGMDTRAYRLKWPNSTLIFDVSPERVFTRAAQNLEDVGAKVQRSCLFLHVPFESSDLQHALRTKGFNGNRPSVWVFQGLPLLNLTSFEEVLLTVSSLAMKGCILLGEFAFYLADTESATHSSTIERIANLFLSHGFQVELIDFDSVAKSLCNESNIGEYKNVLFVAEHLRFSDDQMETWRTEFQRIEDEGDEDGFDEL